VINTQLFQGIYVSIIGAAVVARQWYTIVEQHIPNDLSTPNKKANTNSMQSLALG
jgi:hypothetical protein